MNVIIIKFIKLLYKLFVKHSEQHFLYEWFCTDKDYYHSLLVFLTQHNIDTLNVFGSLLSYPVSNCSALCQTSSIYITDIIIRSYYVFY